MTDNMKQQQGLGMLPDLADFRDYSKHDVPEIMNKLKLETDASEIPPKNDFSSLFTAVRNQGSLGSCTAYASVAGMGEFYNKNVNNDITQLSTLFQYKMTRDLMGVTGDVGAFMRTAMKSMAVYGTVPEKEYPYIVSKFDQEPNENLKFLGQNFQALKYIRVDQRNVLTTDVLKELRRYSSKNIPIMFGFTVYQNSWNQANSTSSGGAFPFPSSTDTVAGGHAICIAGHDDTKVITNSQDGARTTGAFKIRNSWGPNWGTKGFGWVPYKYVEQQLAMDFWVLLSSEFLDLKVFN